MIVYIIAFVNDIKSWMDSNHLMLNQLKTEYIPVYIYIVFNPSRSVGNKVISELNLVGGEKLDSCAFCKKLKDSI